LHTGVEYPEISMDERKCNVTNAFVKNCTTIFVSAWVFRQLVTLPREDLLGVIKTFLSEIESGAKCQ